jgi:phosphoribosylformylglycinamidine synthase
MQNPNITEALTEFLEKRNGLVLGIGSGFQALVKLGLLPHGRFSEPLENSKGTDPDVFITRNTIGRHMSKIVRVRVGSVMSPWFAGAKTGDIHSLPLSTGEGSIEMGIELFEKLAACGQIATQFADDNGIPSYDIRYNPVGSSFAIEALTSPDGRILGRTGHSERNAKGLYLNVPGNYDEGIFASAVAYFR